MVTLESIRTPISADLEAFDAFLERQFHAEGQLMNQMLLHVMASRGKAIRPMLVMLCSAL
jgi:octaprenyl-diphosphate synthase